MNTCKRSNLIILHLDLPDRAFKCLVTYRCTCRIVRFQLASLIKLSVTTKMPEAHKLPCITPVPGSTSTLTTTPAPSTTQIPSSTTASTTTRIVTSTGAPTTTGTTQICDYIQAMKSASYVPDSHIDTSPTLK